MFALKGDTEEHRVRRGSIGVSCKIVSPKKHYSPSVTGQKE